MTEQKIYRFCKGCKRTTEHIKTHYEVRDFKGTVKKEDYSPIPAWQCRECKRKTLR